MNSPFNGDFDNNLLSLYLGSNLYSTLNTSVGNFSYKLVELDGTDRAS